MKIKTIILFSSLFITACDDSSQKSNQTFVGDESLDVSWDIPSTRDNGDALALSEISGYKIYLGKNSASFPENPTVTITDSSTASYTVTNLASGTYYVYLTTYDANGDESLPSDPIIKKID